MNDRILGWQIMQHDLIGCRLYQLLQPDLFGLSDITDLTESEQITDEFVHIAGAIDHKNL